ncbi:alpha/beta hydrolase [Flagellimonas sp. HMM57]|uniref:alpha/beta hydrolase n=1 Tax=unclassified Flagellimonas TaxID=2644544 RepID=UPI0013D4AF77|nr:MULTISPECIES: alpha/beta hydrolase [unclassified Flagellimonas]UII77215.1 alpha/beta hydrolase [Flagellimonas sp. HMM57]
MKFRIITTFIVLFSFISATAQTRYVDAIFSKIETTTHTYSDTLQLDVYAPKKDDIENRPLILLVHGGGFSSGKRDNPLEKEFCITMAKKGYVVASMSYRLLRKNKGFGCGVPAEEKIDTFLAATEDILTATNFLLKKAVDLGVDSNNIILAGSSAGAEAVLNTVFMKNQYQFKKLPYGEISFSGVISFSGAVVDAAYITKEATIPALFFHGVKDKLVPYATAPHHYCDTGKPGYLILDGPESMAEKLKDLNTSYLLAVDPIGNHDWANLAYAYADMIAEFVEKTIIRGEMLQSKIEIGRNQ